MPREAVLEPTGLFVTSEADRGAPAVADVRPRPRRNEVRWKQISWACQRRRRCSHRPASGGTGGWSSGAGSGCGPSTATRGVQNLEAHFRFPGQWVPSNALRASP